jgi:hypothetical protein
MIYFLAAAFLADAFFGFGLLGFFGALAFFSFFGLFAAFLALLAGAFFFFSPEAAGAFLAAAGLAADFFFGLAVFAAEDGLLFLAGEALVFPAAAAVVFLGEDAFFVFFFFPSAFFSDLPELVLSLNEPLAPFPLVWTRLPLATADLRYFLIKGDNFSTSTLYVAPTYFLMACRDDPPRSLRLVMAALTMSDVFGCEGVVLGFLALAAFPFFGDGADFSVLTTSAAASAIFSILFTLRHAANTTAERNDERNHSAQQFCYLLGAQFNTGGATYERKIRS